MTSNTISPADQQHLQSTIENWKRKLLDISKRNRSLNFKPLRVSNITIVDSLPSLVFSKLWIEDANMRFAAAESSSDDFLSESTDSLDDLQPDVEHSASVPSQQFELLLNTTDTDEIVSGQTLYSNPEPEQRRTANILQTNLDDEKLDRSLRRLDEQTHLALEEQGVNILFLSMGMLHYKESVDSSEIFQAPLVLLPVELSRKSSRSGYVVNASGDDAMVNPALIEYLRRNYSIALPELPDTASIGDGMIYRRYWMVFAPW